MTALKGESSGKIWVGNLGCFETGAGAVTVFQTVDFVDLDRPGPRLFTGTGTGVVEASLFLLC